MLWKCCTQYPSKFGKFSSDWLEKVSFHPNPKERQCQRMLKLLALISHASKVMLKILQARLQQYMNRELPDVQAGFRKGRRTRGQIANIYWIIEKARVPVLCPMSESPSRKREGLQDNATGKKGKFITDSSQGPLLHPMQWCKSESPEPKLLHKFIGWAHTIGLSGLVTSLQNNFIGQNFPAGGTFLGVSALFLIS